MYQQTILFLIISLITIDAVGMRTKPMISNKRTVITAEDKEHTVKIQKLKDCQTITQSFAFEEQSTTLSLPGITSEQWQTFQECLEEKPEVTRTKLNNKKRAYEVLTTANYLEHAPLMHTAMTAWSEQRFKAVDEFELPTELDLGVAVKTIKSTPLESKLPIWTIHRTKIKPNIITLNNRIWSCCANNATTQIAAGGDDGTIIVVTPASNETFCWPAHTQAVSDVHYSPDNNWLFSVAQDGAVKVWDTHNSYTLARQFNTENAGSPFSMHLNPQGTLLATDDTNGICLFDVTSGENIHLEDAEPNPKGIAFNKTGSLLAAGNAQETIQIWDMTAGTCIKTFPTAGNKVIRLQFNTDSTQLVAGCRNGLLYVWNLQDNTLLATIPAHSDRIWGLEFSPCNRFLFSGSADKTVKIHDLTTNKCIKSIRQSGEVHDLRLTSDLQLITGSKDKKIRLYPIKPFLDTYQKHQRYFKKDISLAQAQLIQQAFDADSDDPVDISTNKNAETFKQFPPEIATLLRNELPIQKLKSKKKKRKTDEELDPDYIP